MKKVTTMAAMFVVSAMMLAACGGSAETSEEATPEVQTQVEDAAPAHEEHAAPATHEETHTAAPAAKVEEKVEEAAPVEEKKGSLKDNMGSNETGGSKLKDKVATEEATTTEAPSGGKLKDRMKK